MTSGNSPKVVSNQTHIHDDLERCVNRHLQYDYQKPYAKHSLIAFDKLADWLDRDRPLILDNGCGTGESSFQIASQHPDAQILACDKSSHRLNKAKAQTEHIARSPNLRFEQVDLVDLLRWLVEQKYQLYQHYILYPNPWPKSSHIQRRWHGSAVFPSILQLGGKVVLRSNWKLYLEEFQAALRVAGVDSQITSISDDQVPLTAFEKKYQHSHHELWELIAFINQAAI